jgi:hypothetical protein
VAIWLCKLIYLPFALALLSAHVLALCSERNVDLRSRQFVHLALPQTAAFLAPLALWMSVIWLRHDLGTLASWCLSYINFAFTHSTGVEVDLPGLQGWRFSPGWPEAMSLLSYSRDITLPYLLPLASGPLLLAGHALLRARGVLRSTPRERYFLNATVAAIGMLSLWFFVFDPTQWGRHLMTAVYVSIVLATYCFADIWKQKAVPSVACTLAVVGLGAFVVYESAADVLDEQRSTGWKMSFASTCHGLDLVHPPCRQDDARQLIAAECGDNVTCIQERRRDFLHRAKTLLEGVPETEGTPYTAAFLVIYVQHNAYTERDEFENDFRPVLCSVDHAVFRKYLEEAGFDVAGILRECDSRNSSSP